ncbi:hypothetical protein N8I77_001543 [Diaporthe amygdali]|uniref:Pantoate--beta-alanine ligase n=1 Tax=Phomopsis amygdali TaxID=1214568 RepID=A0AAD9SPA1_PHOAM|nr:hypothetical protein N8I77_001543 [Diaporthe amygdali]
MFARAMQAHAAPRAVATAARRTRPASFNAPTLPALLRSFSKSSSVAQKLDMSPQLRPNFVARQLQVPIDPTAAREPLGEAIPDTPIAVLRTVTGIRDWASLSCARSYSDDDQGLALVPTMGALHDGHLRLIREAVRRGHNKIVVSIYVNPAQFGVTEDLDSYPKTWDADCAVLRALYEELNAEYTATARPGPNSQPQLEMAVFAPTTPEMYPSGFPGQEVDSNGSFVTITPVGGLLEGKTRPTFFRGVATVCMKLFNIVQPSRVFFGQKDVQQTVVIRKMVRDFCMPLEAVVVPTVRDEGDGLALSSRNVYLGTRRRKVAPVLIRALSAAERAYVSGALDAGEVVPAALKVILDTLDEQKDLPLHEGVLFQLDYISLADPDTMEEIDRIDPSKGAILSGAVKMLPVYAAQEGEDLGHNNGPPVRLIDNIILPPKV